MQGLRRLGEEVIRTKFSKRELRTGRSKLVWNTADGVLTRKSEHLRMVSDWLWYRANAVIDRRCTRLHSQRGPEHPLAGKPRDSRKLLSTLFVCGICGGLMHAEGRNEGGYPSLAISFAQAIREVSCERGFACVSQQPSTACPPTAPQAACPPVAALRRPRATAVSWDDARKEMWIAFDGVA